jgi:hypothetical protein
LSSFRLTCWSVYSLLFNPLLRQSIIPLGSALIWPSLHRKMGPASWFSGQSFWLLVMGSRVRFSVLPWGFFLEREDSHVDSGLGSLAERGFKTSWYFIFIYHDPPHRDNVTAPHGRPKLRSRLHFGHNREGRPRSP